MTKLRLMALFSKLIAVPNESEFNELTVSNYIFWKVIVVKLLKVNVDSKVIVVGYNYPTNFMLTA